MAEGKKGNQLEQLQYENRNLKILYHQVTEKCKRLRKAIMSDRKKIAAMQKNDSNRVKIQEIVLKDASVDKMVSDILDVFAYHENRGMPAMRDEIREIIDPVILALTDRVEYLEKCETTINGKPYRETEN